jgi:hypoxanthine-guanine phosphoribosyltransferase
LFRLFLPKKLIFIAKMVSQVEADFADETPVFVGVLNGAFMVVADFMKQYKTMRVSFIKMSSYEGIYERCETINRYQSGSYGT